MNKRIILALTFLAGVTSPLFGMQPEAAPETITIVTNDDQRFEIPKDLAEKSEVIKSFINFPEFAEQEMVIPLPNVSSQEWRLIYPLLEKIDYPIRFNQAIDEFTTDNLLQIINAVDYLAISTIQKIIAEKVGERIRADLTIADQPIIDTIALDVQHEISRPITRLQDIQEKTFKMVTGESYPYSLAWSSDGYLAQGSLDGGIRVFDTDGRFWKVEEDVFSGIIESFSLAWSPNGELLAAGSDDGLRIFEIQYFEEIQKLTDDSISSLAWSPDGNFVAAGSDEGVTIWRTTDWQKIQTLTTDSAKSLAWSPNSELLAVGSDDGLTIWRTADWQKIQTLTTDSAKSLAWSPNGQYLASGFDDGVTIWRTADWEELKNLTDDSINSLTWSSNEKYLAAGSDEELIIWNTSDWSIVNYSSEYLTPVDHSLAWSPDGNFLASGATNSSDMFIYNIELLNNLKTLSIKQAVVTAKAAKGETLSLNKILIYETLPQGIKTAIPLPQQQLLQQIRQQQQQIGLLQTQQQIQALQQQLQQQQPAGRQQQIEQRIQQLQQLLPRPVKERTRTYSETEQPSTEQPTEESLEPLLKRPRGEEYE